MSDQLNRWAGETLMGWVSPKGTDGYNDSSLWFEPGGAETGYCWRYYSDDHELWQPTERIEQAMECANLQRHRSRIHISDLGSGDWHVVITDKKGMQVLGSNTNGSLPLAIMQALYAAAKGAEG
jgi:hypothetical protein